LCIPYLTQPWETLSPGKPSHIASPLEIMIQAPVGAAAFNNEFGRPNISGYFRTYLEHISSDGEHVYRGYHKPIMIAGGVGSVREHNIHKQKITPGSHLIVLGGPSMLIGLGKSPCNSQSIHQKEVALHLR
jgi:phosphoribosylformylglycinamidine synthase